MSAGQTFGIRFVLQALLRFRRRAACFFLVALVLTVVGILLAPRQYGSEAQLFLRVGRQSVSLDPTATTGQVIGLNESRQSEVNSALELLRSRALREQVVDCLGPEFFFEPATGGRPAGSAAKPAVSQRSWQQRLVQGLEAIGALDPVDRRERAVQALGRSLECWVPRGTYVLAVACRSDTPERAQAIVSAVVECFREAHLRAHRTPQSYDFFDEQTEKLQQQIAEASRQLRQRKSEFGLLSVEGQRILLDQQRTALEQELTASLAQLAASRAKLQALTGSVQQLPEREITEQVDGLPNHAADNMRQLLYQLEIQEQELASQLTDAHPKVLAVRRQRGEVKAILADQADSRTQVTTTVSPTHQPLQLAALLEAAELQAWQSRRSSLEKDQARLVAAVGRLNRQEVEIARLERELLLLEADYRSYAERREQSRIDQVLAEERISNINVVQPATLVRKPVSPRKLLTLLMGLLAGVTGSVSLAILSAWFDRSFSNPEELELALEIPVLLSVPRWQPAMRPLPLNGLENNHNHHSTQ